MSFISYDNELLMKHILLLLLTFLSVKTLIFLLWKITGKVIPVWPRGWVQVYLYSSMTAALEVGEWSAARPVSTLPPGKTRYPFCRRLGGPQGRSGLAENLVPTGIFFLLLSLPFFISTYIHHCYLGLTFVFVHWPLPICLYISRVPT